MAEDRLFDGSVPTVLIVDDEPDVADAYAAQIAEEYETETAYSGEEALSVLGPEIDIALLDRRMPDVSGDDVLEHVRDVDYKCRVAMVTAVDPDFDIIEMPFDDYVIKPVTQQDLLETIDRLVVCAEYEATLQEYYSLTSKHATLLANKSDAELADSDEFAELKRRREDVRAELEATVAEFDNEAFATVFRELHEGGSPPS